MFKFIWPLLLVSFSCFSQDGVFLFKYEREKEIQIRDEHGKISKQIETYSGSGTAFHVNLPEYFPGETNLYLTAGHNVYDENSSVLLKKMWLDMPDGEDSVQAKVEVFYFNSKFDMALIRTKRHPTEKPIALSTVLPKIGQPILIAGCPKGVAPIFGKGKIAAYFVNDTVKTTVTGALSEASVDYFYQGNSGGPILSEDKSVCYGMVVSGPSDGKGGVITTRAFFIQTPIVKMFLEEAMQKLNRK